VKGEFSTKDIVEIAVGSIVLALPVSLTEEVWNLGSELSLWRTGIISLTSIFGVGIFVYYKFYEGSPERNTTNFFARILTVYFVANVVAIFGLLIIDKLPLIEDPLVAINRIVLVAFPASFGATIVDSLR